MATIARLNKFQRLRYLNPENYTGESNLCFWRTPNAGSILGYNVNAYEDRLSEWLSKNKPTKPSLR